MRRNLSLPKGNISWRRVRFRTCPARRAKSAARRRNLPRRPPNAVRTAAGRLKIGMYATVAFETGIGDRPVLTVPDSAVIDSGIRQAVLIERGGGKFEPREVKLGAHADGFYEVRQGLAAGERVVVSANFLIDAESNL